MEEHSVILTVATEPKGVRLRARHMSMLKFRAYDDSGTAEITFFNQDYLKDKFGLGSTFRFWGKVERVGRRFAMSSPAFEPWYEDRPLRDLLPVYRLSEGLTQKQISEFFGNRDRTTILYSIESIKEEVERDSSLRKTVENIIKNAREQ